MFFVKFCPLRQMGDLTALYTQEQCIRTLLGIGFREDVALQAVQDAYELSRLSRPPAPANLVKLNDLAFAIDMKSLSQGSQQLTALWLQPKLNARSETHDPSQESPKAS